MEGAEEKEQGAGRGAETGRGDAAKETGAGCCLFPGLFIDGRAPCPQRLSDFRHKTDFPHQEERRRQLKVKLGIKEQLRLRREEEEERRRREREEEQKEMEERRKEAAKSVRRLNERV